MENNKEIEQEIFKKVKLDFAKLIKYGFKKDNSLYRFEKNILNDKFKVKISIDNNLIDGKIYDLKINDVYTNFRLNKLGEFASKVKNEYIKLLEDIKSNCGNISYFMTSQGNRICKYIIDTYNDNPEFLWDKYPGYGIFRNKINNKWYAVILNINKSKFSKEDKEVEVINLKVNSEEIEKLLKRNAYFEGFHMNKKNWITIILDEEETDKEIFKLIDESYKIVDKK